MPNKYYVSRDDGETTGPFEDPDTALLWAVKELAEGEAFDSFLASAKTLVGWHNGMVSDHVRQTSWSWVNWNQEATRLIESIDWIVFGIHVVVGDHARSEDDFMLNFIESHQLHRPDAPFVEAAESEVG